MFDFLFQLSISSEFLPDSLHSINITSCSAVKIADDAFSRIPNLSSIHMDDVGFLRIAKNNWTQTKRSSEVSITVKRVTVLQLDTDALSNWPQPGPRVTITDVDRCIICKSAIDPSSSVRSLVLRHVQNLTMSTEALLGRVDQLTLWNVTVGTICTSVSFGGHINSVAMHFVNIADVRSGCMYAGSGWGSLKIYSSFLGRIRPFGINGKISKVAIEDSDIDLIDSRGLYLDTAAFGIRSSRIKEMEAQALQVSFTQSASLRLTAVGLLRENALSRLESHEGHQAALTIDQLTVDNAANGSLTFSERTQVTLSDVLLQEPCRCDMGQSITRPRAGDAAANNSVDVQQNTVRQVFDQLRCAAGAERLTLLDFLCGNCSRLRGEEAAFCLSSPWSSQEAWVVGVGAPVLVLLLALGVSVMMAKRTRSGTSSPARSQISGRPREPHTDQYFEREPVYSEIQELGEGTEGSRNEGMYAEPTPHCSSHRDCHQFAQQMPEYSQPLPRPPSSIYCEMAQVFIPGLTPVAEPREQPSASSAGECENKEELASQSDPEYWVILPRPPSH